MTEQLHLPANYKYNLCRCGGRMLRWKNNWSIYWQCEHHRWWKFWKHDYRLEGTYY